MGGGRGGGGDWRQNSQPAQRHTTQWVAAVAMSHHPSHVATLTSPGSPDAHGGAVAGGRGGGGGDGDGGGGGGSLGGGGGGGGGGWAGDGGGRGDGGGGGGKGGGASPSAE